MTKTKPTKTKPTKAECLKALEYLLYWATNGNTTQNPYTQYEVKYALSILARERDIDSIFNIELSPIPQRIAEQKYH